jgi:hypothetical protein
VDIKYWAHRKALMEKKRQQEEKDLEILEIMAQSTSYRDVEYLLDDDADLYEEEYPDRDTPLDELMGRWPDEDE